MTAIHVSEHRPFQSGPTIQLAGVTHGWALPLPLRTTTALKKILSQPHDRLYTEIKNIQMLPEEFTTEAIKLDGEIEEQILRPLEKHIQGLPTRRTLGIHPLLIAEIAANVEDLIRKPKIIQRQLRDSITRKRIQKSAKLFRTTPRDYMKARGLVGGLRSWLWAARIYQDMEHLQMGTERKITTVSGRGHAYQLSRFFDNPRVFIEYGKMLEGKIARNETPPIPGLQLAVTNARSRVERMLETRG